MLSTCESSSGVEHHLAKVRVAGSNPVFRSLLFKSCSDGGIGRHVGLKIQWPLWPCGFKSRSEYLKNPQLIVINEVADFFVCIWQHIGNKSHDFNKINHQNLLNYSYYKPTPWVLRKEFPVKVGG